MEPYIFIIHGDIRDLMKEINGYAIDGYQLLGQITFVTEGTTSMFIATMELRSAPRLDMDSPSKLPEWSASYCSYIVHGPSQESITIHYSIEYDTWSIEARGEDTLYCAATLNLFTWRDVLKRYLENVQK